MKLNKENIQLAKGIFAKYQKLLKKHGAMTVNERLWLTGYMQDFITAINKKDTEKIISIYVGINVDSESIFLGLKKKGIPVTNQTKLTAQYLGDITKTELPSTARL